MKEGQERAKSVDLTNNRIDEAEQKLKRELAALSTRAKEAGFVVNTVISTSSLVVSSLVDRAVRHNLILFALQGKLWRQSNFQPPDKNCQQIKERKAAFLDWKETASIELQHTRLMHLGQQVEEGVEDPMISPRDMTEAQAERALKVRIRFQPSSLINYSHFGMPHLDIFVFSYAYKFERLVAAATAM